MSQMYPETLGIYPSLQWLDGNDSDLLGSNPLLNLEADFLALDRCFDPAAFGKIPEHSPLTEAAFLHAPPKCRRKNIYPASVIRGSVPEPAVDLGCHTPAPCGVLKLGRILCHPAPHPLQRPVGLVGRRCRLKVSEHRLGEGNGAMESLLLRPAEHPLRGVGISRCDDGDRRQARPQSPGRLLLQ